MTEWGKTRHGTNSGYSTHQHLNERPCDPCFNAKKAYVARRYADPERLKRRQFTSRAQGVATTKLRAMFPEIYQALYTAAKEELTKYE